MGDFDTVAVWVSELDASEVVLLDIIHDGDLLLLQPGSPLVNLTRGVDAEAEMNVGRPMISVIKHQKIRSTWNVGDPRMT